LANGLPAFFPGFEWIKIKSPFVRRKESKRLGSQRMKKEGLTTLKKILPIDLSTSADRTPLKSMNKAGYRKRKKKNGHSYATGNYRCSSF